MSEGRGLTRPAMGVGSLLIFFTRLGLIELSNLIKDTEGRGHHKLNFNYSDLVMPLKLVSETS